MQAGGLLSDEQLLTDLPIRPALGHQRQHLSFASGQA
jgi:hypothetical protein